jgi:hypothetical protein
LVGIHDGPLCELQFGGTDGAVELRTVWRYISWESLLGSSTDWRFIPASQWLLAQWCLAHVVVVDLQLGWPSALGTKSGLRLRSVFDLS